MAATRVVDRLIRDNQRKQKEKQKRQSEDDWEDTIQHKVKPFYTDAPTVFDNVMDRNAINTAPSVFERTAVFHTGSDKK